LCKVKNSSADSALRSTWRIHSRSPSRSLSLSFLRPTKHVALLLPDVDEVDVGLEECEAEVPGRAVDGERLRAVPHAGQCRKHGHLEAWVVDCLQASGRGGRAGGNVEEWRPRGPQARLAHVRSGLRDLSRCMWVLVAAVANACRRRRRRGEGTEQVGTLRNGGRRVRRHGRRVFVEDFETYPVVGDFKGVWILPAAVANACRHRGERAEQAGTLRNRGRRVRRHGPRTFIQDFKTFVDWVMSR
jgi:hypothetical protein